MIWEARLVVGIPTINRETARDVRLEASRFHFIRSRAGTPRMGTRHRTETPPDSAVERRERIVNFADDEP